MQRKISLITMGAGNTFVLKETLESFKGIVDEVVYGDLILFPEDREVLEVYKDEYNINIQKLPFNYIYHCGFANLLNLLAANAKNDLCLYVNTSEVIDEDYGINDIVDANPECNSFYFSHRVEKHRWFRMNDKTQLQWGGFIHEEATIGDVKPYFKPIFMMKDLEKDMLNPFKVKVLNSIKEAVYFKQYMRIVENPKLLGATNEGWLNFAKEQYESMALRIKNKGNIITALETGNYDLLMETIHNGPEFKQERFESSTLINFQGARKDVL